MRIHTFAAAILLLAGSFVQTPAFAEGSRQASLTLTVVGQDRTVLPAASVTIYTLDGNPSQTVTADANGVATFATLPAGMAQVVARDNGFAPYIEAVKLKAGRNSQTVTLHARTSGTSGS